jgi:hypothetical protein
MYYKLYLHILSQLSSKGMATITFEDETLYIKPLEQTGKWQLSAKVFEEEEHTPSGVHSCISSYGNLRWQQRGAYLQFDPSTQSVSLIDEIEIKEGKFISFKRHMHDFMRIFQEWREILCNS